MSTVPQSCPPACVCSASAVRCFPPSSLCDGILPGGGKFIPPLSSPYTPAKRRSCFKIPTAYYFTTFSLLHGKYYYLQSIHSFSSPSENILPDLKYREHGRGPATTWNSDQLLSNTTARGGFTPTCNSRKSWSVFIRPKHLEGQAKGSHNFYNKFWKE